MRLVLTVEQEPLLLARVSSKALLEVAEYLCPKTPKMIMTCVCPSIQNNSFIRGPFSVFHLSRTCARMILIQQ